MIPATPAHIKSITHTIGTFADTGNHVPLLEFTYDDGKQFTEIITRAEYAGIGSELAAEKYGQRLVTAITNPN